MFVANLVASGGLSSFHFVPFRIACCFSCYMRIVVLYLTDKCLGGTKKREIKVGKLEVMIIFVGSFQEIIYGTIQYREALQ